MNPTEEYVRTIESLNGDTPGRVEAWDYLKHSTNIYRGTVVACDFFPKLFDARLRDRLCDVASMTYGIFKKIMQHYLDDPAYREVYDFDPLMERLILADRGYESYLPFARIDLFLNEEDLSVPSCEFNADGASGMNENREAENAIAQSESFITFAQTHTLTSMNPVMFDAWPAEFLRIYRSSALAQKRGVTTPHVALVDYLEASVLEEFKLYREKFEARGIPCSIFDVRNLSYDGTPLTGMSAYEGLGHEGLPIDAIWRRAVGTDVLEHRDESEAFISAYLDGNVVLIGSFLGQLIHDKQVFRVMRDVRTQAFLTPEEIAFVEATIPKTEYLSYDTVDVRAIKANKDGWVIKPTDGYGSKDVFCGPAFEQSEWEALVDAHVDAACGIPFVVPEFVPPYKPPSLAMRGNPCDEAAPFQQNNNLTGLYIIDGQLAGIFSRLGPNPLILGRMGGLTAPSFWVDCASPFCAKREQAEGIEGETLSPVSPSPSSPSPLSPSPASSSTIE